MSDVKIDPNEIAAALNAGKKKGVLKIAVAEELGMTPVNLGKIAKGEHNTVSLKTIRTIERMTGYQILPDFLMMGA